MTENKPTTKWTKLKVFFKWLFITALTILLILGLIFQAPWKVLTLFAVIIISMTIIPKPIRKYIYLTYAAVFLLLVIWIFLPEDDTGWRPYTIDNEIAAFEAARAVPEDQNAGPIYMRLIESTDPNAFDSELFTNEIDKVVMHQPWSSDDYPKIAQWLETREPIIQTLLEAAKKDKCTLPVPFTLAQLNSEILHPPKHWAQILIRSANNDLVEGLTDEALNKFIAALKLGSHLNQQPTNLFMLTGHAIQRMAMGRLKAFALSPDATPERLAKIENALLNTPYNWQSDFPHTIDQEKLFLKNGMIALFYEQNAKGRTRTTRNFACALQAQYDEADLAESDDEFYLQQQYWEKRRFKLSSIVFWFVLPSSPEKLLRVVDANYERFYNMAKPDYDWQKEPVRTERPKWKANVYTYVEIMTRGSENLWSGIHNIYLQSITVKRGSIITVALRRYKNANGNWPESLNAIQDSVTPEILADPINGDSFVYKLTNDSFMLYSKGANGIDENGKWKPKFDYKDGKVKVQKIADDILIWPEELPETEETDKNDQQQDTDSTTQR